MVKKIPINSWQRKEHYEFFSKLEKPYYEIVSEIDASLAFYKAKEYNCSFFIYYIFMAMKALNSIEEFRYRIKAGEVLLFDKIDLSSTIGREDNTFGFSYIEYNSDLEIFKTNTQKEIDAVKNSTGLRVRENEMKLNVVHCTVTPWLKFSGLSLAMSSLNDCIPKITFGKCDTEKKVKTMPASIHAHHGLVDGYHAALYFERLQKLLNGEDINT
ncbi:MAG: chloramphenicol acetyltransferase [Marinilabiliales bacterium]|nr:MAG: chloramphenicol acetyltransferase [Marinilabiliales bacterium]